MTVHTSGVSAYHKIVRRGIKNNEDVVEYGQVMEGAATAFLLGKMDGFCKKSTERMYHKQKLRGVL